MQIRTAAIMVTLLLASVPRAVGQAADPPGVTVQDLLARAREQGALGKILGKRYFYSEGDPARRDHDQGPAFASVSGSEQDGVLIFQIEQEGGSGGGGLLVRSDYRLGAESGVLHSVALTATVHEGDPSAGEVFSSVEATVKDEALRIQMTKSGRARPPTELTWKKGALPLALLELLLLPNLAPLIEEGERLSFRALMPELNNIVDYGNEAEDGEDLPEIEEGAGERESPSLVFHQDRVWRGVSAAEFEEQLVRAGLRSD